MAVRAPWSCGWLESPTTWGCTGLRAARIALDPGAGGWHGAGVKTRWFVRGDIDGFFGLFLDNLFQLMVISVLGHTICGFPRELVNGRILPGAAVSILLGNLFYAWQARQLARRTGAIRCHRPAVRHQHAQRFRLHLSHHGPGLSGNRNATLAWQAGLFACFLSGIMETLGSFVGDWLRRQTPRAALLAALSGIAIAFIAMGFVFQIFATPIIALLPLVLILISYASGAKLPLGIPGGLVAVVSEPCSPGGCAGWVATISSRSRRRTSSIASTSAPRR